DLIPGRVRLFAKRSCPRGSNATLKRLARLWLLPAPWWPDRMRGCRARQMERPASNDVWVILAAYREAKVIANVVGDVKRTAHHVVVVDDGSSDQTAVRAAQ